MNTHETTRDDAHLPRIGFTLPQRYFISDAIFGEEQEKLFGEHWLCVGRRDELTGPGDFVTIDAAGANLIYTVDQEGHLQAFFNNCRHRGTRLVTDERGTFAGCRIRCPYHSWSYSCAGDLLSAPRMDEQPSFQRRDWPLSRVWVSDWQGFVFVNLSAAAASLPEAFATFSDRLDPWQLNRLRVAHTEQYDLATNWKLVLENFSECYHCSSIHPGLAQLSPPGTAENDYLEGLLLGGPMELTKESMTMTGERCCPVIDTLGESDRRRTYYYTLFPNLMLALHPDFVVAWRIHPRAPNRTRIVCQWLFQPESMAANDFDPAGSTEFWDTTNRQDWSICEQSFAGISSRGYRPGPLSANEVVVRTLDQQILAALGHTSVT